MLIVMLYIKYFNYYWYYRQRKFEYWLSQNVTYYD